MNHHLKLEKIILNISFVGSILFLLAELIMAYITHSNAVIMDCVFDIADLIMIGPFLLLIPLLYKPETEKRPYGFAQVESLFIMIKSSLLILVTLLLIIGSVRTILIGGNDVDGEVIATFEIIVSITCILMYFLLSKLKRKHTSPSIEAELYIWKLDCLSTMGVGLAFIVKAFIDRTSMADLGPYIDPVIAIILAVVLLKEPLGLFIESVKSLVLFSPDKKTSHKIREICRKYLEANNCFINFLDIIKTGRKIWIEVYFVVDKDLISINKMKDIHKRILDELKDEFDSVYVELIPDMEEVEKENVIKMKINRRPDKINRISKIRGNKEIKKIKNINKKSEV